MFQSLVSRRAPQAATAVLERVLPAELDFTPYPEHCFEEFAEFSEAPPVYFPKASFRIALARWMAVHCPRDLQMRDKLARCRTVFPKAFDCLQGVKLYTRSFFLPPGISMFSVQKNPQTLPETPPEPVHQKFLAGLLRFPAADFYYLEPMIQRVEGQRFIALSDVECERELRREEAALEQLIEDNRLWWQTQHWGTEAAKLAEKALETMVVYGAYAVFSLAELLLRPVLHTAARARVQTAAQNSRLLSEDQLRVFLDEATQLGMEGAKQRLESEMASRVRRFDPLLVFAVDGKLLLAGHWYPVKDNGKTHIRWHV